MAGDLALPLTDPPPGQHRAPGPEWAPPQAALRGRHRVLSWLRRLEWGLRGPAPTPRAPRSQRDRAGTGLHGCLVQDVSLSPLERRAEKQKGSRAEPRPELGRTGRGAGLLSTTSDLGAAHTAGTRQADLPSRPLSGDIKDKQGNKTGHARWGSAL